ncbi:inverted formin-2-like isoform X2 [Saccostrea echinata]|uniref:inverted formin-2-like isoform X2 n=1 Tax=Saccostrea echinata TaxID=191078 RepID=UPI002A829577|nr:inverted formin-2-like isoform X2 [Saccostrea echinata]
MALTMEEHRDSVMSELEIQMKNASPEKCITLSNSSPSVKMFYALRLRLENTTEAWLREYLERDGLDIMLNSLCEMTGRGFTSFSDAILQLDCVSCIRAILNTNVGLDFMVRHEYYTAKLILALNMNNTHPKKQVYEILSALCSYNKMGYRSVMNALETLKKETDQTYRFSAVVNELKAAETVPHKTAILTFINCIINCTSDRQERNRIRNEFIGLNLLDVLNFLRKEEVDNDLHLQLQIFHEKKHEDEEVLNDQNEVDFNSPEDLVELIQCKIFGTPKMVSFLNILQDLLAIEHIYSKNSAKLWKQIDNLVHQSVHACEQSQLPGSIETPAMELASLPDHINKGLQYIQSYQSRPHSLNPDPLMGGAQMSRVNIRQISQRNLDPCKYENDTGVELTHNRDPRYNKFNNVVDMIAYMDQTQYDNVSFTDDGANMTNTPTNKSALQRRYRIKRPPLPPPTKKMKNVPWVKISDEVIDKYKDCLWVVSADINGITPDFGQLETMFQQGDQQYEEVNEIVLLNTTTRQNINLFLSRMEIGPEKLIESLEKGNPEVISVPTLQYLMKVLPHTDEIAMLQKYEGRRLQLGMPEQFVLLLADIPDYQVLIEGHLTKAESTTSLEKLEDSLSSLNALCKVVLENQQFKHFLHFLLCAGNFLNYGCLQGDAAGIKLSSFERLMEVKSGVPNQSLLHHLVKAIHDKDDSMLKFIPEMGQLDKITLSTLVEIKDEINKFNKQLSKFMNHLVTANIKLRQRFHMFIEEVKLELLTIQSATNQLKTLTLKMANFFCEDQQSFDLEATLQCLHRFCKQVKRCQNDNATFNKQSQLAKKKNDQIKFHVKNRFMALEFGRDAGASSSILEDKHKVLEKILDDLHHGNFHPVVKSEVVSPDIDIEALEFSEISFIGSPVSRRPVSEVMDEDFLTPTLKHVNIRTSSAADILSDEPKFEQELITTKEASPEIMGDLPLIAKRVEELKVTGKRRSHSRSRSDLTDSILITEKWMKYEELLHQESMHEEGAAPLAEPESMCNITSLNLENNGKSVDLEDLKYYEEQQKYDYAENICCVQEGPVLKMPTEKLHVGNMECKPKPERKSSVSNFFTKISRAVLKPRNTPEAEAHKGKKEKFGMFGRRKPLASDDKENIPCKENIVTTAEKRFASREYKRFKNEKSRVLKQVK